MTKSRLARMRRSFFDVHSVSFISSYLVKVMARCQRLTAFLCGTSLAMQQGWFARDLLLVSFPSTKVTSRLTHGGS
jgi:hypothetical protein